MTFPVMPGPNDARRYFFSGRDGEGDESDMINGIGSPV